MRLVPMRFTARDGQAVTLGAAALACALLGLFAWLGYGTFALRGIRAVMSKDLPTARRMSMYAGYSSLAQLALGAIAIALGWSVSTGGKNSGVARGFGCAAVGLGAAVLLLSLLLV